MYDSPIIKKEDTTLKDEIRELKEAMMQGGMKKKVEKKFRVPMKANVNKAKAKQNYAIVVLLNENGSVDFQKEKIVDQTVVIDGVPRLVTGKDVFNYKGKPLIILPSWSVKPFSANENYQHSLKDGSNTAGYRLLLARMKAGAIVGKKKFSMGMAIAALAIIGIIVFVVAS